MVETIKQAIRQTPDSELAGHASNGKDALFYLQSTTAKVALVQLALQDLDGFELIDHINQKFPDIYVVPILEGNEGGEVWQRILQFNLRDVINGVMTPVAISGILKNAATRAKELGVQFEAMGGVIRGKSYMIAVASARGGTGKSVFATNLTLAMARQKAQTLLIDYSMYPGDFLTMLDRVPRNTLADAIGQGIDLPFLNNLVADHPSGFKFLACPNDNFDVWSFDFDQSLKLIQTARGISEFTVIDTGAHDLPPTFSAIQEADVVFLLTTRDLSRLAATQRYIKTLGEREVLPQKIKVVVNNAQVGIEISEGEVEEIIGHDVAAYLPSNAAEATYSINAGKPLMNTKPEMNFCKVINKLSEMCLKRWQEEES